MTTAQTTLVGEFGKALNASLERRSFIKVAALSGIGVMLPSLFSGCRSDGAMVPAFHTTLDFTTSSGALNILWATVQLQDQFYSIIVNNRFTGMLTTEQTAFTALRSDKEFLDSAFPNMFTSKPITELAVNFESVDFSDRTSVMSTAQILEEVGVEGVNGAIMSAKDADAALAIARIASVLARDAARVRNLIDTVANGATGTRPLFSHGLASASGYLDLIQTPAQWAASTKPYFQTIISIAGA